MRNALLQESTGSGEQTAERRFRRVGVWPRHRWPERAEYRPSVAGRFRAEASALFWLKASSESGARGRRHVRPDGLRFAEIFAAPNGGKAAVLLRMSRESLKRNLRRETAGRHPCIPRAICTHGEAAQAENVPNISAVNRNGQQTAMRDPQRQGYAGDGPGTGFFARQRIAQTKRRRTPRKRRAARRTDGRKAARLFRRWQARRAIRRFCGCIDKRRRRKSAERVSTRRGLRACPYCFQKNTARAAAGSQTA